jgi:glycerophosphoryl diester phosphodiesterase
MTITAHSGAFGTPDNSIEYVRKVLAENCEIFEIDVTFRPDGTPVVIHDGHPRADQGILLRDVFALAAEHPTVRMNLDLKSVANLPAVDALLDAYGLKDRAFYTGVNEGWVQTVRENSSVPYYLNADVAVWNRSRLPALQKLAEKVRSLGAVGINTHYSNCRPAMVKAFHEKGMPVSVWTVNDAKNAAKYAALGVDNITTRKPDLFREG